MVLALIKEYWRVFAIGMLLLMLLFTAELASSERKRADAAEQSLASATSTIHYMTVRQRDAAALDAKYTKELSDAKAENDALQRKLDHGGRVLVKGQCPVPAEINPSGTNSVGDDAAIELSPASGRNVLSIRSGIVSDRAKIIYLQQYIQQQCLK